MATFNKFKNFFTKSFTAKGDIINNEVHLHKKGTGNKEDLKVIAGDVKSILSSVSSFTAEMQKHKSISSLSDHQKLKDKYAKVVSENELLNAQLRTKYKIDKNKTKWWKKSKSQKEQITSLKMEINFQKQLIDDLERQLEDLKSKESNYQIEIEKLTKQLEQMKYRVSKVGTERVTGTNDTVNVHSNYETVRKKVQYFENLSLKNKNGSNSEVRVIQTRQYITSV